MFTSTVADVNNETASDAAAAARLAQRERAEELAVVQDWRALQHKGYDYSFDDCVLLLVGCSLSCLTLQHCGAMVGVLMLILSM
jgi:hypothetical protein